jgi:acyl-CoA synthetase (AMP-forming)/AMP-acid ligase II
MFDNLMLKLDEAVTSVLGQWDLYTTAIFGVLITAFIYSVISYRDPDAHPMLLARQAQASPVRQEGQSAVFRSHSAPHGIPLNAGLNIKDPGDSKWTRGRDGDLRDIWRRVVTGGQDREGKHTGEIGKLLTVLGKEHIIEHDLADVTRQINLIGQHIKQNGGKNVAIYLPNSLEFLATLFACSFYDLTAILVPYDQPIEKIIALLKQSKADTVVAAVGSFPFDVITKSYPALQQLIWVVDEGSKHMDWNEVPKGTGGAVNVSTWQEIIQDQEPSVGKELPAVDKQNQPKNVIVFWPSGEIVEFTQANIIAGVAGQLTSIPTVQRITHADLFLPVDSLSTMYSLVLTLAALFSNASVAMNSVAGLNPDLVLATQGIAPTIITASPGTLAKIHYETTQKLNSKFYQIVHWFQTRSLVQYGVMPLASMFSRAYDSLRPVLGAIPGRLRLIYVAEPAGAESTPLSSGTLSDLRVYLGARIIYALTTQKVAGAVTQTGLYDYRINIDPEKYSHFGVPVTSVEIFLKDTKTHKNTAEDSVGEIHVNGPAVVGGGTSLGLEGRINKDHTLSLL